MGKKYIPSGYQIIDLGILDLSSAVTITKGENTDADVLIELAENGKLTNKPILLKFYETNSEKEWCAFVTMGDSIQLLATTDDLTSLIVINIAIIPNVSVQIGKKEISLE